MSTNGTHNVRRPRTVLVLGGGGMRGMAHVGILKALRTLGIQYDAIVGTSIGSLVGAMAAGGYSLDRIESMLGDVQKQDYFRLNVVKFLLKGARAPSMYRGDTFRQRLTEILPDVGFDDFGCGGDVTRWPLTFELGQWPFTIQRYEGTIQCTALLAFSRAGTSALFPWLPFMD